jgi:hypothetical protein
LKRFTRAIVFIIAVYYYFYDNIYDYIFIIIL